MKMKHRRAHACDVSTLRLMNRSQILQSLSDVRKKLNACELEDGSAYADHLQSYTNFVSDRINNSMCILLSHMYVSEASCINDVQAIRSDMCLILQRGEQLRKIPSEALLDLILEIHETVGSLCMSKLYV